MVEPANVCTIHAGNSLDFYCNEESCHKEICKKCVPDHPKHHIILNDAHGKPGSSSKQGETAEEDMSKSNQFMGELVWNDGKKTFVHEEENYKYVTVTSQTKLPPFFTAQVKILKLQEETGTFIGISKRNVGKKTDYRLCREDDDQYAYCNFAGGRLFSHCDEWKPYGCTYVEGDVVTITLDKTKTLTFFVNGENCGPAFSNMKGYFYLAVTANFKGNAFEIVQVKKL